MKQLVKHVSVVAVAFAMTVLASSSAQAQTQMDLSAGYQFAHLSSNGSGLTFPYGWYVDFSDTIHPMIAIVGEVGGVYKSQDNVTLQEYNYQGGARMFSAVTPMITPYGQFLIGGSTYHASGTSASAFSLQLGGGVNVKVMDPISVRVAVDYRHAFFSDADGGGENDVRVALGVVIPLGK